MSNTGAIHPKLAERIVDFMNERLADDENPVVVDDLRVFQFSCFEEPFMFFRVFIDNFDSIVCDVFANPEDEGIVHVNFYECADQFTISGNKEQ